VLHEKNVVPMEQQEQQLKLFSVVIPARNEAASLEKMVKRLDQELTLEKIDHEILVVDDGSSDNTWQVLEQLSQEVSAVRPLKNDQQHGYGRAVVRGLDDFVGDAVVIMMADESDDPRDAVRYWRLLADGHECVFGSRFSCGGAAFGYPKVKWAVNRLANWFIKILFRIQLNDTTNAFKAYRRYVIEGCRPFLSPHFNLTVELPLKAIVRGYTWVVTPVTWRNREQGYSKLKIKEMGSRYLFIVLYVWLEKYFSQGDYRRSG